MNPKIILAVSDDNKTVNYVNALEAVGGEAHPFYKPQADMSYDGLMLCGGVDINPKLYGQENTSSINIDYERDYAEYEIAKRYIEAGKPVFGICRGLQMLNIVLGGTLIQHIAEADAHRMYGQIDSEHTTVAVENSFIYNLYGHEFTVNSAHHQAIDRIGDGLEVVQKSSDGAIIEAVAHKTLPVSAVQWHPERMCCKFKDGFDIDALKLFEYFVNLMK